MKEPEMQYSGTISKTTVISLHFQGKPLNITVIQVYAPTSNAEEAEVEWFYEDRLYSLQPKMEKLYTVSKNKTRS